MMPSHRTSWCATQGWHSVVRVALACVGMHGTADAFGAEFDDRIAPIFITCCLGCHNSNDRKGELDLTSRKGLMKGGDSGPAIVAGKPDESLLLQRVTDGEMPPEQAGKASNLTTEQVSLLRSWIGAGAPWPSGRTLSSYELTTDERAGFDWWSLRAIVRPPVPKMESGSRTSNVIDAFVRARLKQEGITPAPPSDPRLLIRRVYDDLIGLPPTYEEIEAVATDRSPDAYEKLVDRLLGSPHFGERWGRYWLDLVRFAETCGYERDQVKPHAWKYRDWVINAVKSDMPFDRFVLEQLAGDELEDCSEETVIATGFLRLGTWNDEPNDPLEYKFERLEDLVHTTSTAFLGMTVKCARCHDHKFDPIPQSDYYRIGAIFWAGYVEPRSSELLGGPSTEELGYDVLGYTDRGRDPPALRLLKKGDPHAPQEEVAPGFLSMIRDLDRPVPKPPGVAKTSRRRLQLARWLVDPRHPLTARVAVNRLWLHHFGAGLVRTPDNFGFNGQRPTHPDLLDWLARELIDGGWTMKRLHKLIVMSDTYRQASLHPLDFQYGQRDPENQFLWRAFRRRLDAETLRDSLLCVSGTLDRRMGGPSFVPAISEEATEGLSMKGGAWHASPANEQHRRSIYMFTKRSLLPPFMTVFDFCDTTQPCAQRDVTIVPTQALALLNNEFVHEASRSLGARIASTPTLTPQGQVEKAWQLALGRLPTPDEGAWALAHVDAQKQKLAHGRGTDADSSDDSGTCSIESRAMESLVHVLLNTNEFMFVD